LNAFDLAVLLNIFSLTTIAVIRIWSSIESKTRKCLLLLFIPSLELVITKSLYSTAIGVLLVVLTGCLLWLHIKYWQKIYVWLNRKRIKIRSLISYPRSLYHTIAKTKSGQVLTVIFLISLAITPNYVMGLDNDKVAKIASTMFQFNGSFIGLFFVFLGFSYIFTPQKPIKVFDSLHFRLVEYAILLILINTFLLLIWINSIQTRVLAMIAFSIEEIILYILGIVGIDFVTKRIRFIEEEITRAKTEELLRNLEITLKEDVIYAQFWNKEMLLITEGFYTILIRDLNENNVVDYFANRDGRTFKGKTISSEGSELISLDEVILEELKSPERRYEVYIHLYIAAIEKVVSDRYKHHFDIEINLFNPPKNPAEIKMIFITSAYLEKEFRRVKQDIEAGAMVI